MRLTDSKQYIRNKKNKLESQRGLSKGLGSLVEIFGHLQSSAGEAAVQFSGSLTSAQYGPERVTFLNELTGKMSETTELPTMEELRKL